MNMMRKTSGLPLPFLPNCKFGAKTFLIDHLIVYDPRCLYWDRAYKPYSQAKEG
jgi:hypothetical protein